MSYFSAIDRFLNSPSYHKYIKGVDELYRTDDLQNISLQVFDDILFFVHFIVGICRIPAWGLKGFCVFLVLETCRRDLLTGMGFIVFA